MRRALYILGVLNDEDAAWLAASGQREYRGAGSILVREGGELDSVFIILTGTASVSLQGRELARLGAGDIVGEMSLADALPPSATVTFLTDAAILTIGKADLLARLAQDTGFAARFYRALAVFLASRMRETVGRMGFGAPGPITGGKLEDEDELDPAVLDNVHLAGLRFLAILNQQLGQGARL